MMTYYTDGSASPNPGPGGYAVIKNGVPYAIGGEPSGEITTNIRMEGLAILAALEDAAGEECQIYSDSEFWINVITKWAPGWQANGWKKKSGEIKNIDIVQAVYPRYEQSQATLTWVRGHEGDEGNELADEWANIARERAVRELTYVSAEQSPLTPAEHAESMLTVGQTMQLASLHDGAPRVTSVFFVPSDDLTALYWLSEPSRRHSVDCEADSRVAAAIAVKTDMPVRGLQAMGNATRVTDIEEIRQVTEKYSKKYHGLASDFVERFTQGNNQHQLYKMTLTSLELFDEVHYSGQGPVRVL